VSLREPDIKYKTQKSISNSQLFNMSLMFCRSLIITPRMQSISLTCANGEIARFIGHNAFLRWQAIQDAAFIDRMGRENLV